MGANVSNCVAQGETPLMSFQQLNGSRQAQLLVSHFETSVDQRTTFRYGGALTKNRRQ